MNEQLKLNLELKDITRRIVAENYGTPVVTELLKKAATLSKTPMILELRTAHNNIHDVTNNNENMVVCNSTAEAMHFELLPDRNKTSNYLAENFINLSEDHMKSSGHQDENAVVSKTPSYEELKDAFSRVLSKENYMGLPEFLEKFNEPGLESLENVIPHIILEHPAKTGNGYIGTIGIDPACKKTNQYNTNGLLEICEYRLTSQLK